MQNCLLYDAILDFSVCLKTGSNPADINRFRSHTGNKFHTRTKLILTAEHLSLFLHNTNLIFRIMLTVNIFRLTRDLKG